MKHLYLSVLLLFIFLGILPAKGQTSSPRVSVIALDKPPLTGLIKLLEEQTSYRFYYDKTETDSLIVNIHATELPISKVLDEAFRILISFIQ